MHISQYYDTNTLTDYKNQELGDYPLVAPRKSMGGDLSPIRYMLISQYYDTNTLTEYKKQELT